MTVTAPKMRRRRELGGAIIFADGPRWAVRRRREGRLPSGGGNTKRNGHEKKPIEGGYQDWATLKRCRSKTIDKKNSRRFVGKHRANQ